MFGRFNQEMKSPPSPGSSAAFRWREVGVMNADWTSAGNESRKEKKKQAPSLLCDSITSENFYSLGDLFVCWWWIQFVRKWKGQGRHSHGAAVTRGHITGREWEWESPPSWGDQRASGRGKGPRTLNEPGQKAVTSTEASGMQGAGMQDGMLGCRRQRGPARETVRRRRCHCHFQLHILISWMQSLVKIMSDLCPVLWQIKT